MPVLPQDVLFAIFDDRYRANWRGSWSNVTAYGAGDIAYYSGSTYRASLPSTNVIPTPGATWQLVAEGVGTIGFATKALMDANLNYAADTIAYVTNDSTWANIGVWRKTGPPGSGSWVQSSFDRVAALERMLDDVGYNLDNCVMALVDADGRVLATFDTAGTMIAALGISVGVANGLSFTRNGDGTYTLSNGTVEGKQALGAALFDSTYETDDVFTITDVNGRVLLTCAPDGTISGKFAVSLTEIIAARGTRPDLDTRISQFLSPYGMPKQYIFGEWYLRETRQRLRKRILGESAQLVIAAIGDSWTHGATLWSQDTARTLIGTYGNAGSGWVGFGNLNGIYLNGNVDSSKITVAFAGTWDNSVYTSGISPDLGQATTTAAASKVTITGQANTSIVNLFYIGGVGTLHYRWNGGAWTVLDLTGAGLLTTALAGVPAGAWTLEIEYVSGINTLCGLDIQSAVDGVRFNKIAATGSASSQWATAAASAQWRAGLTALAPNLVTVMLGTNDQGASFTQATYRGYLQTLITNIRTALPYADILVVAPCENNRVTNTYPMSLYTSAAYEVAATNKCAFLDLQYVFGDSPTEYASVSGRPWMGSDLIHPNPSTGGRAIVDAVCRLLTNI